MTPRRHSNFIWQVVEKRYERSKVEAETGEKEEFASAIVFQQPAREVGKVFINRYSFQS